MAVFYDLEDGDDHPSPDRWNQDLRSALPERHQLAISGKLKPGLDKSATVPACDTIAVIVNAEDDPSKINILAAALTCYP